MGIKYGVDENFFKSWSQKMAYVLGYFYADGHLTDASYLRGKYLGFTSIDRSTITKIKKWLDSKHKIIECKPTTLNGRKCYLLRIGSHKLYESLTALGLYPNKSLTIGFPKVPKKFLSDFVRGYFDGDGCIYFEKSKGNPQRTIIKRLRVIFTSGSKKFLIGLSSSLQKNFDLIGRVYSGHRSFQLPYSTRYSVKLFKIFYNETMRPIFLNRKYKTFLEYFDARPQRVDKDIKKIIDYLN